MLVYRIRVRVDAMSRCLRPDAPTRLVPNAHDGAVVVKPHPSSMYHTNYHLSLLHGT